MIEKKKFELGFLKFIVPFIIGIGIIVGVGLMLDGSRKGLYWSLVSAYFFPPLGKESVIPLGIGSGFSPLFMALSIALASLPSSRTRSLFSVPE